MQWKTVKLCTFLFFAQKCCMMVNNTLIGKFQELKTPFYYYDLELLDQTIESVRKHGLARGYHIHYAMKANNNDLILHRMREAGFGVDCVSGKEIEKAVEIGFETGQIAFAGVGKTDEEIRTGLDREIFSFNCESIQEIDVLNELAIREGKKARIALRINPNVKADTHKYITTGLEENKFGIVVEKLPELVGRLGQMDGVELRGIHFHIGSQIVDLSAFEELCKKVNTLQNRFEEWGVQLNHINVGGGLGISYEAPDEQPVPDFEGYFALFDKHLKLRDGQQLHFELGRSLVGQCGSLISRVLFLKEGHKTRFAIVDAGMTELIRPALYQAEHHIDALTSRGKEQLYHVAGPICETSDTFRSAILLPELQRGDLVAIRSCGAYGQVMSSDFNLRERAKAYYSEPSSSTLFTSDGVRSR